MYEQRKANCLEMEESQVTGPIFCLNKIHYENYKTIQTIYKVSKQEEVEK